MPGITSLERMVSKALLDAERNVGDLLTGNLISVQCGLLDSLLLHHKERRISTLAWIRQPPGRPGRGSYPRANGLALALREMGRVERTLFTLDWIEKPEERRRATRELNKGEAQNALKRAIFFHRTGRIRDHGLQAQGHRASALNLVAGAIVLWNTSYLEAVLRHMELQGKQIPPEFLQHLSPLGWQHINLTGDYLWADPDITAGRLRPLRQKIGITAPQEA